MSGWYFAHASRGSPLLQHMNDIPSSMNITSSLDRRAAGSTFLGYSGAGNGSQGLFTLAQCPAAEFHLSPDEFLSQDLSYFHKLKVERYSVKWAMVLGAPPRCVHPLPVRVRDADICALIMFLRCYSFLFYVCECLPACMSVHHLCDMSMIAKGGHWIPCD